MSNPYVLALASHKGGTGRTTATLMLAWLWGQAGRKVAVVDADPSRAASLIATDHSSVCRWKRVALHDGSAIDSLGGMDAERVLVDCPPIATEDSQRILAQAQGVLVCCQAEVLSLRTLGVAQLSIANAQRDNPALEFLGVVLGPFHANDRLQTDLVAELCTESAQLLVDLPIPYQKEIRDWPLSPGSVPPPGLARESFERIARQLDSRLGLNVS